MVLKKESHHLKHAFYIRNKFGDQFSSTTLTHASEINWWAGISKLLSIIYTFSVFFNKYVRTVNSWLLEEQTIELSSHMQTIFVCLLLGYQSSLWFELFGYSDLIFDDVHYFYGLFFIISLNELSCWISFT